MTAPAAAGQARLPLRLRAARVLRPHGVRGELRVELLGGDAGRLVCGLRLFREEDEAPLTVRRARAVGRDQALLASQELTTRNAAESWRGAYLCVPAADARPLGENEWFVAELVGLRAVDAHRGTVIGTVVDVESYVEHDVLVVAEGRRHRRFPMVRAFVHRVDCAAGVIELTPWEEA